MLGMEEPSPSLLRRPFSIHACIKTDKSVESIEILYRVVGGKTRKLSELKKGDTVNLQGPLGSNFKIADPDSRIFLVAGGVGTAPILFLASTLKTNHENFRECEVFIGGSSADDLLCVEDFSKLGIAVHLTTDDGSIGRRGMVTDILEDSILKSRPDLICACGPEPMLKTVSRIAESRGVECQISVETYMACGMGACLGCAVTKRDEEELYLHACLDGPVFNADRIEL